MGDGDAERKRYNGQWSARPFKCPDGKTRHPWLQNGIWALFDYLVAMKKIDVPWLISTCWEGARDHEDADYAFGVDYAFMALLEYRINTLYHQRVVMVDNGVANDNWLLHEADRLREAAAARAFIFWEQARED